MLWKRTYSSCLANNYSVLSAIPHFTLVLSFGELPGDYDMLIIICYEHSVPVLWRLVVVKSNKSKQNRALAKLEFFFYEFQVPFTHPGWTSFFVENFLSSPRLVVGLPPAPAYGKRKYWLCGSSLLCLCPGLCSRVICVYVLLLPVIFCAPTFASACLCTFWACAFKQSCKQCVYILLFASVSSSYVFILRWKFSSQCLQG